MAPLARMKILPMRRVDRATVCKPSGAIRAEEKAMRRTVFVACLALSAREPRELNESEERIIGAPDKFNSMVKTTDFEVHYYGDGASSQKSGLAD